MSNSDNKKNCLIKSTKSQSPDEKDQNNQILVDPPQNFDNLIQKDTIEENNNKKKMEENKNNENNQENKIGIDDTNGNIILIDNKNNADDALDINLNIAQEQINNNLENKEYEKHTPNKNNTEKTLSDRKKHYFDEVNNSSIVRKEESNVEFNTNKKSQGSDFALFKIMNELGTKNSIPQIKTFESLDKFNPFISINSQSKALLNKEEENKINDSIKRISKPEVKEEEEEKNNEKNIIKIYNSNNKNKNKTQKRGSEDINLITPIDEYNKDKKTVNSKDIVNTSNNDLNEACIKTNDNLKSKMENSDFIQNQDNNNSKKNNNNNNSMNKINIELLFKPNESKNKDIFIEETKKDIINDINNLYENNKLNLVKINNHEMYDFITDYNSIEKDEFDYDLDYYILNNKDNNFIIRRNNYLSHNYFSYIHKKNYNYNNNDLNDKIKKYKKKYNEKIPMFQINDSNLKSSARKSKDVKNILKINDIENISSFFYNFGLYVPTDGKNKKILDEKSENEIIKTIITYRKIFNDGNSFQRCFSYLLLETFILKNQIDKINYLIYDIKKILKQRYLDIDHYINILIDIKESYSIDNLMNSYNNPKNNIDEIMISYIEDTINRFNKIDSINKRKCQEVDIDYLKILSNIFEVNLEIFYIEENKDKKTNYVLSLDKINIYCDSFNSDNKKERVSDSDEYEHIPTFHLLFFLNSFHIIYTNKSDIDSTLANNDISKHHYYLPSLPKYNCPKCNKNPPLDIIPFFDVILCHKCLINYMKEILKNRVISLIKSNFSSIEYFTRPITIKSEIKITFTLYKYITGNYLIQDLENILDKTCFICYKYFNNNNGKNTMKIIKLKCQCQLCQNCLEEKLKENMGDYKYLNLYEINTKQFTKCPCDKTYNIKELLKYTKNKPNERDKRDALLRLIIVLENKCCICLLNKDKTEYIRLEVSNSQTHFICMDCFQKNMISHGNTNKNMNYKYGNNINRDKNPYHDLESSNSSLKDNDRDKKFFCNICNTEHILLPEIEQNTKKEKNKIKKTISKCCKKCLIF